VFDLHALNHLPPVRGIPIALPIPCHEIVLHWRLRIRWWWPMLRHEMLTRRWNASGMGGGPHRIVRIRRHVHSHPVLAAQRTTVWHGSLLHGWCVHRCLCVLLLLRRMQWRVLRIPNGSSTLHKIPLRPSGRLRRHSTVMIRRLLTRHSSPVVSVRSVHGMLMVPNAHGGRRASRQMAGHGTPLHVLSRLHWLLSASGPIERLHHSNKQALDRHTSPTREQTVPTRR